METWQKIFTSILIMVAMLYVFAGIPLLFEPFPQTIAGLAMIAFGPCLLCVWFLECRKVKGKVV